MPLEATVRGLNERADLRVFFGWLLDPLEDVNRGGLVGVGLAASVLSELERAETAGTSRDAHLLRDVSSLINVTLNLVEAHVPVCHLLCPRP